MLKTNQGKKETEAGEKDAVVVEVEDVQVVEGEGEGEDEMRHDDK